MKKKLAILGSGFLAGIICDAFKAGMLPEYEIIGILGRNEEKLNNLCEKSDATGFHTIAEIMDLKPDIVAEAASVAMVKDNAITLLSAGISLVTISIGAFADEKFYDAVKSAAISGNSKLYIPSGCTGGFDVLRTIALMEEFNSHDSYKTSFTTHKGPASLKNTPVFSDKLLTDSEESCVLSGNAAKAISLLPTKVNVAIAASLASVGPEKEEVNIFSVPGMTGDDHCIVSETEGIRAVIDVYSATSSMAGWSIVSTLKNIVSPVVF